MLDAAGAAEKELDRATLKVFLTSHTPSGLHVLCAPDDPAVGDSLNSAKIGQVLDLLAEEFGHVVAKTETAFDSFDIVDRTLRQAGVDKRRQVGPKIVWTLCKYGAVVGGSVDRHDAMVAIVEFFKGTGQGQGSCNTPGLANQVKRSLKALPHANGCGIFEVACQWL
jgi:hypothetical protein